MWICSGEEKSQQAKRAACGIGAAYFEVSCKDPEAKISQTWTELIAGAIFAKGNFPTRNF
jgi:hypothetical protein